MRFTYENQGADTYLRCDLTELEIDAMSLGMITNNRIRGLAPSSFLQIDGKKYIKYMVSSKIPLTQLLSGSLNRKRLIRIFAGIAETLTLAEEYMLDIGSILLDGDYIFVDAADYGTEMICVPAVPEEGGNEKAVAFFKGIMFSTRFDASEDCGYVAEIINFLNHSGTFSLPQFEELLKRLEKQPSLSEKKAVSESVPASGEEKALERSVPGAPSGGGKEPESGKKEFPVNVWESGRLSMPEKPEMTTGSPAMEGQSPQAGEKEISLFYLLQHYNKENAEAYKARKEAKRQKREASLGEISQGEMPQGKKAGEKGSKEKRPKKEKEGKKEAKENKVTFAVPGQQRIPSVQSSVSSGAGQGLALSGGGLIATDPVSSPKQDPPADGGFGETEYFTQEMEDGGTVLMEGDGEARRMKPYLIRLRNNERIPLDKAVFCIGRSRELADYTIPDNRFVGHSHCRILSKDGEFYVVDNNSKNHTYINGNMIQSNLEVKLSHGAIVSAANEEFEFKLF